MGGFIMRTNLLKLISVILISLFTITAIGKTVHITVLHTNDFHSHIDPFDKGSAQNAGEGGMAKRSALIKKIRSESENVLLFDAGDMFQGTPYYNYYRAKLDFELMTMLGYDGATIGNHEFDNGIEGFESQLQYAGFPFINSNYDFYNTILYGKILPCKIFEKGGVRIGVYGLGIELKGLVNSNNYGNIRYNDPLQSALIIEEFLKEQHCDLIICLSHLGYEYTNNKVSDKVIAAQTYNTNLIIGGHTHTFLKQATLIKNKSGKDVVVNQVGFGGLIVGKVDFYLKK